MNNRCKTPETVSDSRVLFILWTVYRKWAAVRLYRLAPWIEGRCHEDMFARVPGKSAEDAWWLMAAA